MRSLAGEEALVGKQVILATIRRTFYESTKEQRRYFSKLSRTYALLFSLRADPRIVEYFQSMSSSLVLLIGTDILIRALSERYLRPEDQITCNMLRMLKDAGADLVLTQPVVEEVHTHLETTDWEFRNDFMETEPYVTVDVARHSPKILASSVLLFSFTTGTRSGRPSKDGSPLSAKSATTTYCTTGVDLTKYGNTSTNDLECDTSLPRISTR